MGPNAISSRIRMYLLLHGFKVNFLEENFFVFFRACIFFVKIVDLRDHTITMFGKTRGRGSKNCLFLSTLMGKLSTLREVGGQKWQNYGHVVVE